MSLKDSLRVFRWDHLSHYQWASWFAAAVAVVVMCLMAGLTRQPWGVVCLMGAISSMVTAYLAGKAGEWSDARANEAAAAQGLPAPHEVSEADARASFIGCVPSAAPLLALFAISTLR